MIRWPVWRSVCLGLGSTTLLAIPVTVILGLHVHRGRGETSGSVCHRSGHFRGGMAMSSVLACMLFAALSGSSPATVVAIGTIAIAAMRQLGYSGFRSRHHRQRRYSGYFDSAFDCDGGLCRLRRCVRGSYVPRSVIPLAGAMLMLAIYIVARVKNLPAGEWKGFGELARGGKDAFWGLFLVVIVMGGIYGGVFTPTKRLAVAAVYSAFIAVFIYRDMAAEKPWVTVGVEGRIGFNGIVYFFSFGWSL